MAKNDRRNLLKLHKTAEAYRLKGQFANAIREYENIIKLFPQEKKLYNTLGDLYQVVKDKKNAIKNYILYAKALEANGFTLQAIAVYKKITRIDNEDPEVYLKLADLYNQQGIIAESISMYMHLANLYQKQGLIKRAISVYEKVVDLQPDNLKIIALLADQYLKEGMKAEAIDKYLLFADILLKNDEWDKVKNIYNKILELDPDNVRVKKGIGNLYFHVGDFENAEKFLIQALQEYPDNDEILKDLGEVYIKIKDFGRARKIFDRLVTLIPDDISLRKKYAFILLNIKDEEESKKHIDILINHYKSNNSYDKIIDMLNDAKKLRKYFWYAYNLLIDVYSFLKQEANKLDTLKELAYRYYEQEKFLESFEILKELRPHFSKDQEFLTYYGNVEGRVIKELPKRSPKESFTEESLMGDFELESEEKEMSFDIPDDLVTDGDSGSDSGRENEDQNLDELEIPLEDILSESREELIDIQLDDIVRQDQDMPGGTEEVIILDDDLISTEEDFIEEDSADRVAISEAELEREIDQLELNESQEVPLLIDQEVHISKEDVVIENLDIDLIDDSQYSEYDKSMDMAFDAEDSGLQETEREEAYTTEDEKLDALISENLTEAEVFLKFGLTEKAYKHIKAALDINPDSIEAILKLKELYSLEGKNQELIETSIKLAELYRMNDDELNMTREYQFLQSIDPDNPVLQQAPEVEDISYDRDGKDYDNMLEKLILETDTEEDFEIVQDQDESDEIGVSDILYNLKNENIYEQESIAQDLVEADDLFSDEGRGEDTEDRLEAREEEEEEKEAVDKVDEFSDDDLSGEDMEIDSSLPDDFFELVSPDDGEEPYDIGEEMGLVGPDLVSDSDQSITQIVEEFKKGVQDQLSPEDYETHYNLGIAFKEMGLIDDAIEAFEKAAKTGKIMIESISMLGLCYIEQGMYQRAIDHFKRGLEYLEKGSDAYIGMLYDLANVYDISNDPERAYIYFEEISLKQNDFRDAAERLALLETKINREKVKEIKSSIQLDNLDENAKNNPRISYI